MSKKSKRNKKLIHIEYTRVYHNILKYEDVLDTDIDIIFQTYLKTLSDIRSKKDLTSPPNQKDIDDIINLTLDKLGDYYDKTKAV